MQVVNVHQRHIPLPAAQVGMLLSQLALPDDPLWPRRNWPRMRLDRPLAVGATGGHGPIGYTVDAWTPGRSVRFRFTAPRGFDGWHVLQAVPTSDVSTRLEHRLEMSVHGLAQLSWLLLFRPLHDALVEDAMAQAQKTLGQPAEVRPWSLWVRLLRLVLAGAARSARQTAEARHAR